jgi:hypothetical protein
MNYSQKYTLVAFLIPVEVGTEFKMADWPLHITLADVFAIELETGIQQKLTNLLAEQPSLVLSVGQDATLGTTNVALINKDNRLQNLHDKIIDLLELNGVQFNTPEFTRTGFLPHSTVQKSGRLNIGNEVEITSISLVDMFPGGDWQQRKVLNNFSLRQA